MLSAASYQLTLCPSEVVATLSTFIATLSAFFFFPFGSFAISVSIPNLYRLVSPLELRSMESHRLYSFVSDFIHSVLFVTFIHVLVYKCSLFSWLYNIPTYECTTIYFSV